MGEKAPENGENGWLGNVATIFTCALPGITTTLEKPFQDVADAINMINGRPLGATDRAGYATELLRSVSWLDDTNHTGIRKEFCDTSKFIAGSAATMLTGGLVRKGVTALVRKGAEEVAKKGLKAAAIDYTIGAGLQIGAGVALDVTKVIYRYEHPAPSGPKQ